jgi:hypothetical protein
MGGLRISNEVILAKTETTYGTDPTPAAATNAVLVRNVSVQSEGLRMTDRAAVRAGLGKLQKVFGGHLKRITFECEVKGSGSAGTAPEIGPLIEACGFDETIVGATSATYTPEDGVHESVTIWWYEGGRKLHKLNGCRGSVTWRLEAGGILLASFEFVGHYVTATDQTQPTPTYNATVPRAGLSMVISLNGVTALTVKSWEWGFNNTIAEPPSLAAADGYGEIILTDRDIKGSMVLESELVSVSDLDALFTAGTRFAWQSGTLGSVAGNRVAFTTPASSTYIEDVNFDSADGIRNRTLPMAIDDSVATNFSIAFT